MTKAVILSTIATGALIAAWGNPHTRSKHNQTKLPGSRTSSLRLAGSRRSLQTTPIAVTALSSQALTTAKVENVVDLQRTAPGLVIGRGSAGGDGIVFVAIRGQGNLQPILANDPAVATYVDGVYIPRPSTGMTDIQDVERLEVLRGPQGTLFGRNTTGGAINIITKDPTDQREGRFKAEFGNYNNLGVQSTINLPWPKGWRSASAARSTIAMATGTIHLQAGILLTTTANSCAVNSSTLVMAGTSLFPATGTASETAGSRLLFGPSIPQLSLLPSSRVSPQVC